MPWSLTAVLLSAPCETISSASDVPRTFGLGPRRNGRGTTRLHVEHLSCWLVGPGHAGQRGSIPASAAASPDRHPLLPKCSTWNNLDGSWCTEERCARDRASGGEHRKCSTRWRTKFALTRECLPATGMPWSFTAVLLKRSLRDHLGRHRTYRERLLLDREGTEGVPQGFTWDTLVAGSSRQVTRGKGVDPGVRGCLSRPSSTSPQMFHVEQSRRRLVY